MSMTAARKADLIKTYAVKSGDTGSPEVQVALLSERINNLTEHFKTRTLVPFAWYCLAAGLFSVAFSLLRPF